MSRIKSEWQEQSQILLGNLSWNNRSTMKWQK